VERKIEASGLFEGATWSRDIEGTGPSADILSE
jgi:hypothetical protein